MLVAQPTVQASGGSRTPSGSQPGAEIRIVTALKDMHDDHTVMNAYTEANPLGATVMAKVNHMGDLPR